MRTDTINRGKSNTSWIVLLVPKSVTFTIQRLSTTKLLDCRVAATEGKAYTKRSLKVWGGTIGVRQSVQGSWMRHVVDRGERGGELLSSPCVRLVDCKSEGT